MNKRMRELQALMAAKAEEAKGFMTGENKDIEKANALLDEVDALQKEFDTEERIMKAAKAGVPTGSGEAVPGSEKAAPKTADGEPSVDSIKAFADAARRGFKAAAAMTEGTAASAGYTVPVDISTKINTFKENKFSLVGHIDRESVSTNKGSRTYKARAQQTGFAQVGEGAKVGQVTAPQFSRIDYNIKKYAGYLPVTNELLADSDAAIANIVMEWLAGDSVATENAQILAKIAEQEVTDLTGIKDIKKAINVTLSAFKANVTIYTNDDGVQYLDTLEDKNGRPLLSPDPTRPMEMRLSIGARSIPVVQIPNEILETPESGKVPFIMGDLKEYLKMFDRQQMTLSVSDTAAVSDFNAFEQDMTLFRAIMRADFVVKDDKAIVNGGLTVATV